MQKLVRLSMLTAIMITLGIIESYLPFLNGVIPGLKLGSSNIIVIIILYMYSWKEAMFTSIIRVLVIGILRTGFLSINFIFSFTGALLSIIVMSIFKKTKLSIVGISIIGSIFHGIGQILAALILLRQIELIYYLPWITIFSIFTGIIIGMISKEIYEQIKNMRGVL